MHTCTITVRHAGSAMHDPSPQGTTLLESEYVDDMCAYEVAQRHTMPTVVGQILTMDTWVT